MKKTAGSLIRHGSARLHRRQLSQASLPPLQITTLPNKIRVATESTPGHFSSVGLYVDAGSRYELPSTSGASHFLDRMAFKVPVVLLRSMRLTLALAVDKFSFGSLHGHSNGPTWRSNHVFILPRVYHVPVFSL